MITLGSEVWGSGPKVPMEFAYEKQRSGADMQYRVRVTISTLSSTGYFGYPIYLALYMDGVSKSTVTLKESSPSQWSSAITYTSPWYTVANKTSGSTSVTFNVYSGSGSTRNKTYTYSMGVDPAASTLSASSGTLGTDLALTVTKYNSGFTHTIKYTCGTASDTICTQVSDTTVKWTSAKGNTVALSSQNTTGQSVSVTFTIETYSGSSLVGTNTFVGSMAIPASVKPRVALTVTDPTGYYDTLGAYVQGKSKMYVVATPTPAYSSPIKSYLIQGDGKTYTNPPFTTDVIQGSGTLKVTAKVTDARARTSDEASVEIAVLPYSPPSVSVVAYRCNSSGTADSEGAYMKVGFTSTISSLGNLNTATYTVTYSNGSTSKTLSGSGTSYTSDAIACDVSTVWTVEVKVSDKVGSTTKSAVIPIAFTLMDFYSTGKGIAFGKIATKDGFECAMAASFTGTTAMPSGVTVGGKTLLNLIYPVGSIYMSVNNVSPATFFGGTWAQVKDTFLLASGTTYGAGTTGGSATHKLSVSELPAHNHYAIDTGNTAYVYTSSKALATSGGTWAARLTANYGNVDTSTETYKLTVSSMGDGVAHNNMPPYLAVYVWKRTA